ncbi:MAG: nickel pincer cofactor biosynthesis protein LarC [Cyanothece sp. SIO1E1]|nr:nickel pincer cofactor biosynthesis protein LarC [Cyanothece sp. SIO1E1]
MKKFAYLECPTGIAGDMCLGALIHAGVPLEYVAEKLGRLHISDEYELRSEQVHRNGQAATKVYVDLVQSEVPSQHHPAHSAGKIRHLPEIEHIINAAELPPQATIWSLAVFRQLAAAEAAVHGVTPDQVHFHEVGATDALVDIVGTCLGLDWLEIEQLYCSALPVGGGTTWAAHGQLPVPAPAVLKLWEMCRVPVYSNGIQKELVTPTGAAIATTLATHFGPPPAMTLHKIGLGAGTHQLPLPNILRLWIGEGDGQMGESGVTKAQGHEHAKIQELEATLSPLSTLHTPISSSPEPPTQEPILLLETQIDDLNPQAIGYVFEQLFAAGAVDVFTQAIGMKKSRPGVLLTVICHPEHTSACEAVLFRETTTLGIRRSIQQRTILYRQLHPTQTDYGEVHIKVAWQRKEGPIVNVQPEYEDCARLARQHQLPWREVHRMALQAWYLQHPYMDAGKVDSQF